MIIKGKVSRDTVIREELNENGMIQRKQKNGSNMIKGRGGRK